MRASSGAFWAIFFSASLACIWPVSALAADEEEVVAVPAVPVPRSLVEVAAERRAMLERFYAAFDQYRRGDIDGDGHVDLTDVWLLLRTWGTKSEHPEREILVGDITLDNAVDHHDAMVVLSHFGLCVEADGAAILRRAVEGGLIQDPGGVLDSNPAPHTTMFSTSWPPSHGTVASNQYWPNNHEGSISGARDPEHDTSFSRTWPANHIVYASFTWPSNHSSAHSFKYPTNHQQEVSAPYLIPDTHQQTTSRRWPSNHTLQVSNDHSADTSRNNGPIVPSSHHVGPSVHWNHGTDNSRDNRHWHPNHWIHVSNNWGGHSTETSPRYPANHWQEISRTWPGDQPYTWPPGHFTDFSGTWETPAPSTPLLPQIYPDGHVVLVSGQKFIPGAPDWNDDNEPADPDSEPTAVPKPPTR